jgi:hypothetical protein
MAQEQRAYNNEWLTNRGQLVRELEEGRGHIFFIMNSIKSMVTVVIMYGHENYMNQAIEGVLMQECNFD